MTQLDQRFQSSCCIARGHSVRWLGALTQAYRAAAIDSYSRPILTSVGPLLALVLGVTALACSSGEPTAPPAETSSSSERPAPNPLRSAYFGDLHVHTRYSMDAYIFDVRASPDDAYRFAKGEPLDHVSGHRMQLQTPFDFQAVTDHGILLGALPAMDDPEDPLYNEPIAKELRELGPAEGFQRGREAFEGGEFEQMDYSHATRSAWQRIIEAAERHNDPGHFTTFVAYEYTSTAPDQGNLHRNVIFRGSEAPEMPLSSADYPDPEDLWRWLDDLRAQGIEALAIPHNSNGSNGQMFRLETLSGEPLDADYADLRMRNEPLVEVTQVKGTSEVHPLLSPNDEWADFEIFPYRISTRLDSQPAGSYVRDAYVSGLILEETKGFNPFRFGLIGSTDTHNAAGTPDEWHFHSKVGARDGTPQRRGSVPLDEPGEDGEPAYVDGYFHLWGAAGVAGVWAEENTRESIYDAFRRKETFATTGPRIQVRFFAGYDLAEDLASAPDKVARAYEGGIPMGADLSADGERAPRFLLWAIQDPNSAPLQRLQIVKGWVDDEGGHDQVFDVACSDGAQPDPETHRCADNGASVDLSDCSFSRDSGAAELSAVWSDPGFEPAQHAVYYLRVIENPTCRWSTWDALRAGVEPRADLPTTIQERAWSSPIWFVPGG